MVGKEAVIGGRREPIQKREVASSEIDHFVESCDFAIFGHLYQPLRYFAVQFPKQETPEIIYDIRGTEKTLYRWDDSSHPIDKGYNEKITEESYQPQLDRGILTNSLVGRDVYASLSDWWKRFHPDLFHALQEDARDKPTFAAPPTQVILPAVPRELSRVLMDIGISEYETDYKKKALGYWLPELAVTQEVLDDLADRGIRVLILCDYQLRNKKGELLREEEKAPLYTVMSTKGIPMYVLTRNERLSSELAFDELPDAEHFADQIEQISYGKLSAGFVANDDETIGHQRGEMTLWFEDWLVNHTLPERKEQGRLNWHKTLAMAKEAFLPDFPTSWSCGHRIKRWTGGDECDCGGATHETQRIKREYYNKLYTATESTIRDLEVLDKKSGNSWKVEFHDWFLSIREPLAQGITPIPYPEHLGAYAKPMLQLLTCTLGLQSCAFYFNGDYERSMASQTLLFLEKLSQKK